MLTIDSDGILRELKPTIQYCVMFFAKNENFNQLDGVCPCYFNTLEEAKQHINTQPASQLELYSIVLRKIKVLA